MRPKEEKVIEYQLKKKLLYIFHLPVLLASSTDTCNLQNRLNHDRTIMISWSEGNFYNRNSKHDCDDEDGDCESNVVKCCNCESNTYDYNHTKKKDER